MKKRIFLIAWIASVMGMFTGCVNVKEIMDSTNPEIKITIYGNVSDADSGDPLSGVSISAMGEDGLGGAAAKSVTGSDGNYEMEVSTSFSNTIRAEKTKYESVELKINMVGTSTKDQKYKADIQMHKEAVIYKGVIKDTKGYTLSGAKIDVSLGGGYNAQKLATTFSDENGEYSVEVPRVLDEDSENQKKSWTNYVTVSKAGYVSNSQSISHTVSDLGKTYTINFELKEEIN
ncbi:MAG: hypothetical protein IKP02_01915 [Paludibacteraceae bacterium]|nr:hypothetical protein [Paludibacteraceae bacterium]